MATETDYTRKCQQLDVLIDLLERENKRLNAEQRRWIPCKERLPEIGEEVILSYYEVTTIGWLLEDGGWMIYEGEANADADDISAWQPLPEPYKEVDE